MHGRLALQDFNQGQGQISLVCVHFIVLCGHTICITRDFSCFNPMTVPLSTKAEFCHAYSSLPTGYSLFIRRIFDDYISHKLPFDDIKFNTKGAKFGTYDMSVRSTNCLFLMFRYTPEFTRCRNKLIFASVIRIIYQWNITTSGYLI